MNQRECASLKNGPAISLDQLKAHKIPSIETYPLNAAQLLYSS